MQEKTIFPNEHLNSSDNRFMANITKLLLDITPALLSYQMLMNEPVLKLFKDETGAVKQYKRYCSCECKHIL